MSSSQSIIKYKLVTYKVFEKYPWTYLEDSQL